jgi:hypothetical protein
LVLSASSLFGAVHADGIVSSDIVGYATDNLTKGKFNMNAVVFNNIDGSDVNLNEDVTFVGATGGYDETDADSIQIWDAATSGYTVFYYDIEDLCWYDAFGNEEPVIPSGCAFWYRSRGTTAPSITQSGAVENAATCPVVLTKGKFNMVINPYPTAYSLNDTDAVTFENSLGGYDETDADSIQVWDAGTSGYTVFYYDVEDLCWYDAFGNEDPDVPGATPYWYRSRGSVAPTITFKKTF